MAKEKKHSLFDRFVYIFCNSVTRLFAIVYFRFRVHKSERYPLDGPVLICANHQSHMAPILVANGCTRYVGFVARESLFKFKPFGWLITTLGAFPINRDGGIAGIKETLKRLKRGEVVLIFPEGTRTPNGTIQNFKSGFCAIARRSKVPIVPVAIDGAYDAWPKNAALPRPRSIKLKVGHPIMFDEYNSLTDTEITERVQSEVAELQQELNPKPTENCAS